MRRFLGLVLRIIFFFVLSMGTAFATPATPPPPVELRVAGGLFTPTRTEGGIEWRAHWVLTPESTAELAGGATGTVRFAMPLADCERVDVIFGVAPLTEAGHVVGVIVDRTALDGRTVRAILHQRVGLDRAGLTLGAPVAAGTALQIVDGDVGAGARFEIETGRVLQRSVGFVAAPGISHSERQEARRLTGYDARVTGAALYVRGDDVRAANGITASLVTPRARARHSSFAIAIIFGAMVLALVAALRKLRHSAGVERADALLAAEVDALDALHKRGS